MKLRPRQKKRLIENAERVYLGYLALDFSKTKVIIRLASNQSADPFPVVELFQIMAREGKTITEVVIGGNSYTATLTTDLCGERQLTLSLPVNASSLQNVPVQALAQYSDEQVANLFTKQPFKLGISRDQNVDVSLSLADSNRQFTIGGPGKYDLYRTHLISLSNIIKKLKTEEDLSALLVALATGTGKTFVQALWIEVLYLTEVTGIFAVPDELIRQFVADMRKLLPEDLVDQIKTLRTSDSSDSKGAEDRLNHLTDQPGSLIVADSFRLMDRHHKALLDAPSDTTFLSVDEQHLLMSNERRRKLLLELPNHLLCMFLTATPDKETFELSGECPVASMSSRQKAEAGQGRLPKFETIQVPFFGDLNRRHTKSWLQWMKNVMMIHVPNMLFPEVSSAAQFAIERLPFHFHYDVEPGQVHSRPRWNLHAAAARKILVVVDDNETLVNFMHYLRENPSGQACQHIAGHAPEPTRVSNDNDTFQLMAPDVYSRGAFEPNGIHNALRLRGAHELIAKERAAVWEAASAQLPNDETRDMMKGLVDEGLVAQMRSNMFHYLVEYVLSDLTGFDQITLNKMRKNDLKGLTDLVKKRYFEAIHEQPAVYYETKLQTKIDGAGAEKISTLLKGLYQYLGEAISKNEESKINNFVDNWFLDKSLMTEMTAGEDGSSFSMSSLNTQNAPNQANHGFGSNFNRYANQYLVMSVMTGMADAETQVADSRPFTDLEKASYPIFDNVGRFTPQAKPRQRHSIQILIGRGNDNVFTPQYCDGLTEEQADNYFRFGFIGIYVSNKKQKGFSDPNLHTVLNLAEQTVNPNNSPEITIQASGRNRGLDETVVPSYIHVLGHKQITNFDPKLLDSNDYYRHFFRAQGQYNEQCIDLLGVNLAKRIRELYFKYKNTEDASIDATSLHAEITEEIALYLRNINNRNSHNIGLSRKQLTRVVAKAMVVLEDDIKGLRDPYKLSPALLFIVKSAISSAQAFFYAFNFIQTRKIQDQLKQHQASLFSAQRSPNDSLYLKLRSQPSALDMGALRKLSDEASKFVDSMIVNFKMIQSGMVLPKSVQTAIDELPSQVDSDQCGRYPIRYLMNILNYSPEQRQADLTRHEKQYVLPKLEAFEALLVNFNVSKAQLAQYVAARAQSPNTGSFDQAMVEVMQLFQQIGPSNRSRLQFESQEMAASLMASNLFIAARRMFEVMGSDELAAMLKTQRYNDLQAEAGARRVQMLIRIVQSQNVQDFQNEFLTSPAVVSSSSAEAITAAPLLFDLIKDCSACGKALLNFNQSRFDKTYLKIVRQTHLADLISKVAPGMELLAWLRKKAPTVKTVLFDHIVAKGTTDQERTRIKQMLMELLDPTQAAGQKSKSTPGADMANLIPADPIAPMQLLLIMSQVKNDPGDINELVDLLADHIAPIIFHSQIAEMCRLLVGKLDRDDLIAIFEAHNYLNPASGADHILRLLTIVKDKDLKLFAREFLLPKSDHSLAFMDLINECMIVGETVLECSQHFSSTDLQGNEIASDVDSRNEFVKSISEPLRRIKMPHQKRANLVNQTKGFIKGLTELPKISGEANGDDIRFLTRIKNHILRPIWWTASLSKWAFSFVETARNVVFWFRDLGFTIWNKLSQFSAWMQGKLDGFRPSKKSTISVAYEAKTLDFVRDMNNLKPLTVAEVAQLNCPDDTIAKLRFSAAPGTNGLGFFRPEEKVSKLPPKESLSSVPLNQGVYK